MNTAHLTVPSPIIHASTSQCIMPVSGLDGSDVHTDRSMNAIEPALTQSLALSTVRR